MRHISQEWYRLTFLPTSRENVDIHAELKSKYVFVETVIWWLGQSHHTLFHSLDWVHRLWGKFLNDAWDSRLRAHANLKKPHTSPWDRDTMETVVFLPCDVVQAAPHAYKQMTPHSLAHWLSAFFPLSSMMECSAWPVFVFALFLTQVILKQRR